MKPWLVEILALSAGLALALATVGGAIALSSLRQPAGEGCGSASMALTLALEPSLDPAGILAGVDAAAEACDERHVDTLSD